MLKNEPFKVLETAAVPNKLSDPRQVHITAYVFAAPEISDQIDVAFATVAV